MTLFQHPASTTMHWPGATSPGPSPRANPAIHKLSGIHRPGTGSRTVSRSMSCRSGSDIQACRPPWSMQNSQATLADLWSRSRNRARWHAGIPSLRGIQQRCNRCPKRDISLKSAVRCLARENVPSAPVQPATWCAPARAVSPVSAFDYRQLHGIFTSPPAVT